MLRKIVKEGYKWKSGTFRHEFSNAENNHQFIAWQQQNFITHMIRGENSRRTKRLLFDDDGRETNTLSLFIKLFWGMKKLHPINSITTSCPERFRTCSWQWGLTEWCYKWPRLHIKTFGKLLFYFSSFLEFIYETQIDKQRIEWNRNRYGKHKTLNYEDSISFLRDREVWIVSLFRNPPRQKLVQDRLTLCP